MQENRATLSKSVEHFHFTATASQLITTACRELLPRVMLCSLGLQITTLIHPDLMSNCNTHADECETRLISCQHNPSPYVLSCMW